MKVVEFIKGLFDRQVGTGGTKIVPGYAQSADMKKEYCCTLVRIGEIKPIEGKDLIGMTLVNELPVVVRKDQVKEGDVLFYVDNECQINADFCRINNLYDDPEMNDDHEKRGYFNKYGRVRIVKLGGIPSMGYLFGTDELCNYIEKAGLAPFDTNRVDIGFEFDTISGECFVKAFVPPVKEHAPGNMHAGKRNRAIKKFDRMIDGQFSFHYDTGQLEKNIRRINPENYISVTVKEHGTSFICGNILVKRNLTLIEKIRKLLRMSVETEEYDYIYSSRKVIKNSQINTKADKHFYGTDIWGVVAKKAKEANLLDEGMTIYGEIVGYVSEDAMAQKEYDYGCVPGQFQLMIYRITKNHDGETTEFNVIDVCNWTKLMIREHPELAEWLKPITVLYWGEAKDLYKDVPVDENWHENVIARMKSDKNFGMELNEPMCKNKVPREGIVLRIDNDPLKEAFKLKTMKFRFREAKEMDAGNVDVEMQEAYEN